MQINKQQWHIEPFLSCPQIGRLHTSEPLGWRGIVVEQRYHPAGEYVYPGSSSHMLCLHTLLLEVLEGGISGRIYAESLGTALVARLVQAYTSISGSFPEITVGLPAPLIRKVTAFIEEHLSEDLGLVELASEVGLSPSHFASLFRKTTGLSPHHYVIQRRLKQAQQLLKSTRLSIGEIATAVGFYDQSHLVRHMRRAMGVTPTYIRKNLS
ncbi:MAG: helix-turn-helix domain-containing protein [Ktedonobacteraceae bacterium]